MNGIAGYIDRHDIRPGVWEDALQFLPVMANAIIARLRTDLQGSDSGARLVRIRGDAISDISDGPDSSDSPIWSVRVLFDLEQGGEKLLDISVGLDYYGFGDLRMGLRYGEGSDILFGSDSLASIVNAMRDIGMTLANASSDPVVCDVAAKASADIADYLLNGPREPAGKAPEIEAKSKKGFFARLFGRK